MVSIRSSIVTSCVVAAVVITAPLVAAHQRVISPGPVYTVADRGTNWGPQAFLENQGFKTSMDFNSYLKDNGYKTLRDFMDKPGVYKPVKGATFECGFTDPKAPPQPIPKNGEMRTSGYTHEGPCEIWLDNVLVKSGDNCNKDIPTQSYKIDYSSCKGNCMLRWYWLGVRPLSKISWQIYKACIPLVGNGRASNGTNSETGRDNDGVDPAPAPVPAPRPQPNPAPAPRPEPNPAPAPRPQPNPVPGPRPQPNPAPAPAPGKKCNRRRLN